MAGLIIPGVPVVVTEFRDLGRKMLTTAEVLYYIPDHPSLLQSFLWQTEDQAPDYPRVQKFLDFWRKEIDAVIHSVAISSGPPKYPGSTHQRIRPSRFHSTLN